MKSMIPVLSATLASLLLLGAAHAQSDAGNIAQTLKTGEQVYQQVCIACHDSGVAHAPKKGDQTAWKPLIEEGQGVLTGHAWVGVRAMPAKGGQPDLQLEEFARAVAWMAREAGADWQDLNARMMRSIRKEAEKRLDVDIRERQKMRAELHRLNERSR